MCNGNVKPYVENNEIALIINSAGGNILIPHKQLPVNQKNVYHYCALLNKHPQNFLQKDLQIIYLILCVKFVRKSNI